MRNEKCSGLEVELFENHFPRLGMGPTGLSQVLDCTVV